MNQNPERRFCIRHDDDGHACLVPAFREVEFYEWVEEVVNGDGNPDGYTKFEAVRIDNPFRLTFTDPREN